MLMPLVVEHASKNACISGTVLIDAPSPRRLSAPVAGAVCCVKTGRQGCLDQLAISAHV